MNDSKQLIQMLLGQLKKTRADEIQCEEAFEVLDVYADARASGKDPSEYLPLVKLHLELCRDCLEEYEALLAILENEGT